MAPFLRRTFVHKSFLDELHQWLRGYRYNVISGVTTTVAVSFNLCWTRNWFTSTLALIITTSWITLSQQKDARSSFTLKFYAELLTVVSHKHLTRNIHQDWFQHQRTKYCLIYFFRVSDIFHSLPETPDVRLEARKHRHDNRDKHKFILDAHSPLQSKASTHAAASSSTSSDQRSAWTRFVTCGWRQNAICHVRMTSECDSSRGDWVRMRFLTCVWRQDAINSHVDDVITRFVTCRWRQIAIRHVRLTSEALRLVLKPSRRRLLATDCGKETKLTSSDSLNTRDLVPVKKWNTLIRRSGELQTNSCPSRDTAIDSAYVPCFISS